MSALAKPRPRSGRSKQHPVRVAVRDGAIVRLKTCPLCKKEKLCSSGSDSEFWMRSTNGKLSWQAYCKPCTVARQKRWREENRDALNGWRRKRHRERMDADPDYHRRHNEATRRSTEKLLADPEQRAQYNEAQRLRHALRRQEDRARINELARMQYVLRQERKGKTVRQTRPTVIDGTQPRCPAEPLVDWLERYKRLRGLPTVAALAEELGLPDRRVWSYVHEHQSEVAIDVVDRALQNAAEVVYIAGQPVLGLNDLYPHDGEPRPGPSPSSVTCPTCGAEPRQPCCKKGKPGVVAYNFHRDRRRALPS